MDFNLTENDKKELLKISRNTLFQYINNKKIPEIEEKKLSPNLLVKAGAFVSLHIAENLRGCIGRFVVDDALYKIIQEMTISSATQDNRFSPVSKKEIEQINIEISVLTPMKKIDDISEIEIGKHGVYIKSDYSTGTLLPQVAVNNNWNVEEFLGYCSKHKTGIEWDGWKNAEVYIYQAIVFDEKSNIS